jgi:hypothetical protein
MANLETKLQGSPGRVGGFAAILLTVLTILASGLVVQGPQVALTSEAGVVEWLGAGLFAATALVLALHGAWLWAVICALFVLREFDAHDWFFEPGLLHADLLTSAAPLWQKAVGLAVALMILALLVTALWRGARPFLAGLRARQDWALVFAAGFGAAVLSTQLDGLPRKLEPLGITMSPDAQVGVVAVEELLELAFALALLFAATRLTKIGQPTV